MALPRVMGPTVMVLGFMLGASVVLAQVSALPSEIQEKLATVGPTWGGTPEHIEVMYTIFQPLLKAAPKESVEITKNLKYGSDPKQVLDVYQPKGKTGVPAVIFVHGGAYTLGAKDRPFDLIYDGEIFGNVTIWFARQGMVGINADYPLAPAAKWPSGGENVGRVVAWAKSNATKYGGDANRIYVVGHSAGAVHVASYIFDGSLQPPGGPGVAGAVLISGSYRVTYGMSDVNAKNRLAYFGEDASAYPARSSINHIKESSQPVFIVIAEYDNPGLDVSGAELLAAICERDGRCPRFARLEKHNHISEVASFNTADEQLGREILEFMNRGQ